MNPLMVEVVVRPEALGLNFGLDLHFGPFFDRNWIDLSLTLSGFAVVPLDIVPNQLKACALVEWPSRRSQL
jgi:hypothetical protein